MFPLLSVSLVCNVMTTSKRMPINISFIVVGVVADLSLVEESEDVNVSHSFAMRIKQCNCTFWKSHFKFHTDW